jgi:CRP-like cAMP-binding protein
VFPALGRLPINEITPPMVLGLLRVIEARPEVETARRVRQRMSAIFVYAIASGIASADPAADVKGALAPLVRQRGRPVQQGLRLPDRLRQADLADSPGATTRSIITILNSWRAAGLVVYDTDRALLTVRDVAALRAIISTEH